MDKDVLSTALSDAAEVRLGDLLDGDALEEVYATSSNSISHRLVQLASEAVAGRELLAEEDDLPFTLHTFKASRDGSPEQTVNMRSIAGILDGLASGMRFDDGPIPQRMHDMLFVPVFKDDDVPVEDWYLLSPFTFRMGDPDTAEFEQRIRKDWAHICSYLSEQLNALAGEPGRGLMKKGTPAAGHYLQVRSQDSSPGSYRPMYSALIGRDATDKRWGFYLTTLFLRDMQTRSRSRVRHRAPNWSREELILALALYHSKGPLDDTAPEVIRLSNLLRSLDIHQEQGDLRRFRNPNSVSMKLANFESIDPEKPGGLPAGSKLDQVIWDEMAGDPAMLAKTAEAIAASSTSPPPDADLDDDASAYPEGRYAYRLHKTRERDSRVTRKKKQQALKNGEYTCVCCSIDPLQRYGPPGERALECHHLRPLAEYKPRDTTKLADLALVCANCHRVLHSSRPRFSPDQLRQQLESSTQR